MLCRSTGVHVDGVHHRPEQFVRKAAWRADTVLRVAAEDLVVRAELVIDFAVQARDVVAALGWDDQIVGRTARRQCARIVWWLPWVSRQNVLDHGIEAVLRDHVAGERIARPDAVHQPRGVRIVDREAPAAEVEVPAYMSGLGTLPMKVSVTFS